MDMISVIVPAYNCQDTIERCIKSILNQTYKNLEIIIVNDGSTDKTELILRKIQKQDDRIKIVSIPNGGVSHARNIALDMVSGDYVTFVDSDDYIDKEMYSELMILIEEYNVKIAHCSYKNIYTDGRVVSVGDTGKIVVQPHDDAILCLIQGKLFTGGIWNKIYSKELIDGVLFDESIRFNEDILFCFQLFDKADKTVYLDKAFYNYVANENSATHTVSSVLLHEQIVNVARKIDLASVGKSYSFSARNKLAYTLLDLYRTYLLEGVKTSERKELKNEVKRNKMYYTSKNTKVTFYLAMYFPHICVLSYRIYDRIRVKKLDPEQ